MPKVIGDRTEDLRRGTYPWQLAAAGLCWLIMAITLLFSRVGAVEAPSDQTAQQIANDTQGVVLAPTDQSYWFLTWLPWLGVAVLLVAAALLLKQAWARIVLALLGLLAVIALALAVQWGVFVVLITWIAGSVFALTPAAHRYLTRRAG